MEYKLIFLVFLVYWLSLTECKNFNNNEKQQPPQQGLRDVLSNMMTGLRRFLGFITTCYTETRYITITTTLSANNSVLVSDQSIAVQLINPVLLNELIEAETTTLGSPTTSELDFTTETAETQLPSQLFR